VPCIDDIFGTAQSLGPVSSITHATQATRGRPKHSSQDN